MNGRTPNWEFKERDVYILRELTEDPQRSARDIANILNRDYDIEISHVTVSKAIRDMRESGVFREAIIPNESYFRFALLEFKFFPPAFKDGWRDALEFIRSDPNTLAYFLSDGDYQWKVVMMFPNLEAESRWLHEFYKAFGDFVLNVRFSVMTNILKFGTNPRLFDDLLEQD